jgi:hypothetical protein
MEALVMWIRSCGLNGTATLLGHNHTTVQHMFILRGWKYDYIYNIYIYQLI